MHVGVYCGMGVNIHIALSLSDASLVFLIKFKFRYRVTYLPIPGGVLFLKQVMFCPKSVRGVPGIHYIILITKDIMAFRLIVLHPIRQSNHGLECEAG